MFKKNLFFYGFIVWANFCASYADQGLYLIQISQPEKQRIDILWHSFFFLEKQEEQALMNLANKSNLYTYDFVLSKPTGIQRKFGSTVIEIKAQSLDRKGSGGAAQGIELSVSHENRKIVDQLVLKNDDFSKISVICENDRIILSFTPDAKGQIQNYELKTDLKSPIKLFDEIKTQGKTL